jgi:hypothetical protein
MKTRCKFRCTEVKRTPNNGYVTLEALYCPSLNNEDSAFCTHTPSGKLEMSLYPVDRADFFMPGKAYYLDISEAAE